MAIAIAIINAIVPLLEVLAPEIVSALTGGQSAEDAIKAAKAAAGRVHLLEDSGDWDASLERWKERG